MIQMIPSPSNTEHTSALIDELFNMMKCENNFQEKLIRYSDIGMIIIDRTSGQFLFANPAAEALYNRKLHELQEITLTSITEVESVKEIEKGFAALAAKERKSYKMAKVYVIPPNNERKIAFLEMVELTRKEKSPFILGLLIEKKQLEEWLKIVQKVD